MMDTDKQPQRLGSWVRWKPRKRGVATTRKLAHSSHNIFIWR